MNESPEPLAHTCWVCCLAVPQQPRQRPQRRCHERLFAGSAKCRQHSGGAQADAWLHHSIYHATLPPIRQRLAQINVTDLLQQPKVESGRYASEARHHRACRLCSAATAIEEEQHNLLLCPQLADLRNTLGHLFRHPGRILTDLFADQSSLELCCFGVCVSSTASASVSVASALML